uniref:Uncharacterized protein AlNc14C141G7268 n=1 Tax=Albugo laibachii Nc14 TaxID=890382 RepID=F0WL80_9STRA|nr:conserved hypothetical protein [Albugo laibachii Nc14]|eukprot:CCA22041.1 conserved hypothetical protein [Albugo laibachii Nc14]
MSCVISKSSHRSCSCSETTPTQTIDRRSRRMSQHQIAAIIRIDIRVQGYHSDASIMEHPEYILTTTILFRVRHCDSHLYVSTWQTQRSFHSFQTLDAQLRHHFPFQMSRIPTLQLHRSRTLLGMHRTHRFLMRRCMELNTYLNGVIECTSDHLVDLTAGNAPFYFNKFCDFENGFGVHVRVFVPCKGGVEATKRILDETRGKYASWTQASGDTTVSPILSQGSTIASNYEIWQNNKSVPDLDASINWSEIDSVRDSQTSRRSFREKWRQCRRHVTLLLDSLRITNEQVPYDPKDTKGSQWNTIKMCDANECSCNSSSYEQTHSEMQQILRKWDCEEVSVSLQTPTVFACILVQLEKCLELCMTQDEPQHDSESTRKERDTKCTLSSKSVLVRYSSVNGALESQQTTLEALYDATNRYNVNLCAQEQRELTENANTLCEIMVQYGLLHVDQLEAYFQIPEIELKKRLHRFRSTQRTRVGALELILLSTILNIRIDLIINDNADGTLHEVTPLPHLRPLREGDLVRVSLGYMLPSRQQVDGAFLITNRIENCKANESAEPLRDQWKGVKSIQNAFITLLRQLESEADGSRTGIRQFDSETADMLNASILDAVWDDCQQNPNLFQMFQCQAKDFGKGIVSAKEFIEYLVLAFSTDGAIYLVDFLLYVLPDPNLRRELFLARWQRQIQVMTPEVVNK